MTLRTLAAALLAGLLLVPCATAQETYDLRRADEYEHKVGDRLRVERAERQKSTVVVQNQGQVLQRQEGSEGFEATYVDEVLAVDDEGEVTGLRRSYETFLDVETGQDVDVKGLVVVLERGADGKHTFKADGDVTIPPAVQARLQQEAQKKDAEAEGGEDEDARQDALLPEAPVAVGATWEVPPEKAVESFGFEESELAPGASSVKGTLVSVEERDGQKFLKVQVAIDLAFKRFQGLVCPDPAKFQMQLELDLPAGGTSPAGEAKLTGTFDGQATMPNAPPGVMVDLDLEVQNHQRRARVQG